MVRHCLLSVVALAVSLHAFTDLKITPSSGPVGTKTLLTGSYSAVGDTAYAEIWMDRNNDKILNAGDVMLFGKSDKEGEGVIIDGGAYDDSVADGSVAIDLMLGGDEGGFPFVGYYFLVMKDKGGSDTSSVEVTQPTLITNSVEATILLPEGPVADMAVHLAVVPENKDMNWEKIYSYSALTDSKGKVLLPFPDSLIGKQCHIRVSDMLKVLKGNYLFPRPIDTTLSAGMNLSCKFEPAPFTISAQFKTTQGTPIPFTRLYAHMKEAEMGVDRETDAEGKAIFPVGPGKWDIRAETGESPKWLTPDTLFEVTTQSIDVILFGIPVDDSIFVRLDTTGTGLIPSEFNAWAQSMTTSGTRYATYVPGRRDGKLFQILPVSSTMTEWKLSAWANGVPEGFMIVPNMVEKVAPGDTVVFKLVKPEIPVKISVTLPDSTTPVSNIPVYLSGSMDKGFELKTDGAGTITTMLRPGGWNISAASAMYLSERKFQDVPYVVTEKLDTIRLHLIVAAADTTIIGTVTSEDPGMLSMIQVHADIHMEKLHLESRAPVQANGTFTLPVAKMYTNYYVDLDRHKIPAGFYVTPGNGPDYPYNSVLPGTATLAFSVKKATALITGPIKLSIPREQWRELHIGAGDSIQKLFFSGTINFEKMEYRIDLPAGTYTIAGFVVTEKDGIRDTIVLRKDNVTVGSIPIAIAITETGLGEVSAKVKPTMVATKQIALIGITNRTLMVSRPSVQQGTTRGHIYDLHGRVVHAFEIGADAQGAGVLAIPCHSIANGVYILQVINENVKQSFRFTLQ